MKHTPRNRANTEEKILQALEELLIEQGIQGIGINRIAQKAGISKVLIYRYFGGLEGLLMRYIRVGHLLPLPDRTTPGPSTSDQTSPPDNQWLLHMTQLYHSLQHAPRTAELLRAFVTDQTELTGTISQFYDAEVKKSFDHYSSGQEVDKAAIMAVLLAALSHQTLLSDSNRTLFGISPKTPEGEQRIDKALAVIYKALETESWKDSAQAQHVPINTLQY